jgi:hypothetical protein
LQKNLLYSSPFLNSFSLFPEKLHFFHRSYKNIQDCQVRFLRYVVFYIFEVSLQHRKIQHAQITKKHTGQEKVSIFKQHPVDQVSASGFYDEYNLQRDRNFLFAKESIENSQS